MKIFFVFILISLTYLRLEVDSACLALTSPKRLVCYFASWGTKRESPANIQPEDLDPCLCTHILYSFVAIKDSRLSVSDLDRNLFPRMVKWKQINPNIKIQMSVGGWAEGSANFNLIVASDTNRGFFCQSVIDTCRAHGLDGIDIDWEYPLSSQRDQYTALMRKCHDMFVQEATFSRKSRLLLSAATAPDARMEALDIPALNNILDFIMPMTYDIHGSWDGNSAHHSPLYGSDGADSSLKRYISAGMSPDKLNIGLAAYGRATASAGPYTKEVGILAYYEICPLLCESWTEIYDTNIQAPKAQNAAGFGHVYYDNQKSMIAKAQYVMNKNIGGAFIWDTSLDDFNGRFCCQGKFPLITTVIKTFNGEQINLSSCCAPLSTFAPSTLSTTQSTTTTTPTTTVFKVDYSKCPGIGQQYAPHPTDCTKFIVCTYISTNNTFTLTIAKCATGLVFNPTLKLCYTSGGNCSTTISSSTTDYSKCPIIGKQYAPYPGDCSKFLICSKSTETDQYNINIAQCAPGLLFNQFLNKCDLATNVICDGTMPTTPVLTTTALIDYSKCPIIHDQYAIYPGDCTKFIVCTKSSTGDMVINVAQCAADLYFNPEKKLCDLKTNVKCDSSINTIGSPTTEVPQTTTDNLPEGIDYSKCPVIGEQYAPYPGDCSKFLMCSKSSNSDALIITIAQCTNGLLYNPETKVCDHASKVKCTTARLIKQPFYGNLFD